MYAKRLTVLLICLLCSLALASAAPVNSTYDVGRFAIGSGGKPAQSESYALERVIIGQTIAGDGSSENSASCIGLWCKVAGGGRVYLPLVLRNYP